MKKTRIKCKTFSRAILIWRYKKLQKSNYDIDMRRRLKINVTVIRDFFLFELTTSIKYITISNIGGQNGKYNFRFIATAIPNYL